MNTISRLMKFARGLIKFGKDGRGENARFHWLHAAALASPYGSLRRCDYVRQLRINWTVAREDTATFKGIARLTSKGDCRLISLGATREMIEWRLKVYCDVR